MVFLKNDKYLIFIVQLDFQMSFILIPVIKEKVNSLKHRDNTRSIFESRPTWNLHCGTISYLPFSFLISKTKLRMHIKTDNSLWKCLKEMRARETKLKWIAQGLTILYWKGDWEPWLLLVSMHFPTDNGMRTSLWQGLTSGNVTLHAFESSPHRQSAPPEEVEAFSCDIYSIFHLIDFFKTSFSLGRFSPHNCVHSN